MFCGKIEGEETAGKRQDKICWPEAPTAPGLRVENRCAASVTMPHAKNGNVVKLHAFVMLRPGKLPFPCAFQISQASLCDLWAARQTDLDCAPVSHGKLFANRAYADAAWAASLRNDRSIELITPERRNQRILFFSAAVLTLLLPLADSLLSLFSIGCRFIPAFNPLPSSVLFPASFSLSFLLLLFVYFYFGATIDLHLIGSILVRPIPDPETAHVVKQIFAMYVRGDRMCEIQNWLRDNEILTAGELRYRRIGRTQHPRPQLNAWYNWPDKTLYDILTRQEYLGHTVAAKTYKVSYKFKKTRKNAEDKRYFFPNTHEPLIDEETFALAQIHLVQCLPSAGGVFLGDVGVQLRSAPLAPGFLRLDFLHCPASLQKQKTQIQQDRSQQKRCGSVYVSAQKICATFCFLS